MGRVLPAVALITFSLTAFVPTSKAELSLDAVALPRRSAEELGVRSGDILEMSPDPSMRRAHRVRVAVVWDPREHPADVARRDRPIFFHLPALETLLDRRDVVDRIVVRVRDRAQAEQVRDELNGLGPGYDAYTADELARRTSKSFVVISRFHRAIGTITLLASGIFLVTIMTLKLTEIRREIGALRLLGIGRQTIMMTIVALATGVALVGTGLGLGLGAVLVRGINAYYQPQFATHLRFALVTPSAVELVVSVALVLGVGAGVAVGRQLLRPHPLEQVGR